MASQNTNSSIKIIGYIDKSESEIKNLLINGRKNEIMNSKGEFTVIFQNQAEIIVITSPIGAMQYCYFYDGYRFAHGERIIDIVKSLGLKWEWDWESLGDLCELENLTGDRTLHKAIKKVPPGSFLTFNGKFSLYTTKVLDTFRLKDCENAVDAIDILNNETKLWVTKQPFLSLSGGFDSRVILSSMLKQNIFPKLVTLGQSGSSDIRVASCIADTYGLEHIKVSLELDDLLEHGEKIALITNGSKPACHWNTFLYPRKAGVPKEESFFVGTLGEFARSYYFDKGIISLLVDGLSTELTRSFWSAKLRRHRTFLDNELDSLSPSLSSQINNIGLKARVDRNAELSSGGILAGGCRYYLEQRVPNFYANGIKMYNETSQWRSPFHNVEWLEKIWSLSDHWKLGSNWHRLAIKRNYSSLLNFPEEKGFSKKRMLEKAPLLYWHPIVQRMKYTTYDLSKDWYSDNRLREYMLDNRSYLDDVCERSLVEDILLDHQLNKERIRAISFMLTILYFKQALLKAV